MMTSNHACSNPRKLAATAIATGAMVAATLPGANAATIKILAKADGVVKNGTTLNLTGQSIIAGDTQRSAVEFNVAAQLPDFAVINSVSFESLRIITTGSGSITVNYGVYAGDGIITLDDVTASSGVDGTYTLADVTSLLNADTIVPINVESVRQAFHSAGFVGIDVWKAGGTTLNTIAFDSIHDNLNPGHLKPTLIIDYTVPLPPAWTGIATFAMAAGVASFRRRRLAWARSTC